MGPSATDQAYATVVVARLCPRSPYGDDELRHDRPVLYSNTVITATPSGTDRDAADTVGYLYRWFVNDFEVAETGSTLDGLVYFEKGDSVYVEVTAFDGTDYSAFPSVADTVQNSLSRASRIIHWRESTQSTTTCTPAITAGTMSTAIPITAPSNGSRRG